MAVASFLSLLLIRPQDIDPVQARGHSAAEPGVPLRAALMERHIRWLCGGLAMFHLSNAAMLPLLGQRLAVVEHSNATRWLAICVARCTPCPLASSRAAVNGGLHPPYAAGSSSNAAVIRSRVYFSRG